VIPGHHDHSHEFWPLMFSLALLAGLLVIVFGLVFL